MKTRTVIILNGPSASGKTSVQRAFQQLMLPDLWLKMGIDSLFDGVLPNITPENSAYWLQENALRWVAMQHDESGNSVIPLFVGNEGQKVVRAMNKAIAVYAYQGCNIIVDYIAYKQAWLQDLLDQLNGVNIYLIKVSIDLKTLEEREKTRGTSPVGHARSHYESVYGNFNYDAVVFPALYNAEQIASYLKELISKS